MREERGVEDVSDEGSGGERGREEKREEEKRREKIKAGLGFLSVLFW